MSLGNSFGLLPQGFVKKSVDDVQSDLQSALQQAYGNSIDLSDEGPFGQIVGIMAERYAELWNLAEAVNAAFIPDDSTGQSLVNLAAITGTLPLTPLPSTVTLTCTGTPSTVLATGRVVSVQVSNQLFESTAPGTIASVTAWAQSTNYAQNARSAANGKIWQAENAGMSLNSGAGPAGAQGSVFNDNGINWLCLGSGTGAVDIPFSCEVTGPVVAASGTLTQIQTPVSGWTSAYNFEDAVLGVSVESDALFRQRREAELHGQGRAAVEAVRSALLKVAGVTSAIVFENVTDTTNGDGMPPHSVEGMVQGGIAADIAESLFLNVAAGIATTGNQTPVVVTDSQGLTHSIEWSRPTAEDVWIIVNVIYDPAVFPSNGAQLIINNLLAYGLTLTPGYNIFSSQLAAAILLGVPSQGAPAVPGVLDPGLPLIGLSNPPVSSTTIVISSRQLGVFSSGRIAVNATPGSP